MSDSDITQDFSKLIGDTAISMNRSSIEQIPITKLKDNPQNFYGLRDIDHLANSIALSRYVEPLTVEKIEGKDEYLLISGHRRKAAWQKLLDNGTVTDSTLPCIVCDFTPIQYLSHEDCAMMYLMLSNMGQRKIRTVDEKLQEADRLEPIAKKIFKTLPNEKASEVGYFRGFFATKFMNMSSTSLQRLLILKNLIAEAKDQVDSGTMSLTFASELASLEPDEQKSYMEEIQQGNRSATVRELIEYKKNRNNPAEPAEEEKLPEEPDAPSELSEPPENTADEPAEDGEPENEEPDDVAQDPEMDHPDRSAEPIDSTKDEPAEKNKTTPSEPVVICDIKEVPKKITDPQAEAKDWLNEQQITYLSQLKEYADAQVKIYEDSDELRSSQWKVRASVLSVQILMLKGF